MVSGCRSMGPGPSRLGGGEGGRSVETGPRADGRPHQGHAAPDSGPQQQDSDRTDSQSSASGAGDRGHLPRLHPVSLPSSPNS